MPEQQLGMPDLVHIPAIYIGRRELSRIDHRHPVLFGRIVLTGQEGIGKAEHVEQLPFGVIACLMLEPDSRFFILRRIGLGIH